MKLTKQKLIQHTGDELTKLGYREFNDTITGAYGLFVKRITPNFFLTLGFTKSRFYDSRFTADFYLSKTTIWSAIWGDIPRQSFERVGSFLTKEERAFYLDEDQQEVGGDAWWQADRDGDIHKFIETIKITQERFLSQDRLFGNIENSVEISKSNI